MLRRCLKKGPLVSKLNAFLPGMELFVPLCRIYTPVSIRNDNILISDKSMWNVAVVYQNSRPASRLTILVSPWSISLVSYLFKIFKNIFSISHYSLLLIITGCIFLPPALTCEQVTNIGPRVCLGPIFCHLPTTSGWWKIYAL